MINSLNIKNLSLLVPIIITLTLQGNYKNCAVTYTLGGGRLGDQLIAYLHAKWVSYKYNLPFIYVPFPGFELFDLDEIEKKNSIIFRDQFKNKFTLRPRQSLEKFMESESSDVLFIIPFFSENFEEHEPASYIATHSAPMPYFKVNWDDPGFHMLVKKLIKPKSQLSLIIPPKDRISIAVHIRKTSGDFDAPLLNGMKREDFDPTKIYSDIVCPLKHAPESFYLEQTKNMISFFPDKNFYIYLFTDDPNPLAIYNKFKQAIPNDSIIWDYRKTNNNHLNNVLEDLFSMIQFDCLVRPASNYSIIASIIGDFKVVISPLHHYWKNTTLVIDEVEIKIGDLKMTFPQKH